MVFKAAVVKDGDALNLLGENLLVKLLQAKDVSGNLPKLIIRVVRAVAGRAFFLFADAVPVHPFVCRVYSVVGVAASGASDSALESIRKRCRVPRLIEMQVFPSPYFSTDEMELQVAILQNNDVLDPALENLLIERIGLKDIFKRS